MDAGVDLNTKGVYDGQRDPEGFADNIFEAAKLPSVEQAPGLLSVSVTGNPDEVEPPKVNLASSFKVAGRRKRKKSLTVPELVSEAESEEESA